MSFAFRMKKFDGGKSTKCLPAVSLPSPRTRPSRTICAIITEKYEPHSFWMWSILRLGLGKLRLFFDLHQVSGLYYHANLESPTVNNAYAYVSFEDEQITESILDAGFFKYGDRKVPESRFVRTVDFDSFHKLTLHTQCKLLD